MSTERLARKRTQTIVDFLNCASGLQELSLSARRSIQINTSTGPIWNALSFDYDGDCDRELDDVLQKLDTFPKLRQLELHQTDMAIAANGLCKFLSRNLQLSSLLRLDLDFASGAWPVLCTTLQKLPSLSRLDLKMLWSIVGDGGMTKIGLRKKVGVDGGLEELDQPDYDVELHGKETIKKLTSRLTECFKFLPS